jgi:cytochrome c oxidase assembly protein subunit 15
VKPTTFRWFALAAFISMLLIIATGAAVRLTGSGLGCPDWPTCYKGQLTGSLSFHPLLEYANRMVTVLLVGVTMVTFVAAWLRAPRRKDLIVFSLLLVVGVMLEAVLGAVVVYTKLNPWLVSSHLLLSLGMVVLAAILYHRAKYLYGKGMRADVRDPQMKRVARLLWLPFIAVVVAGTITTGSGPHAGSSRGQMRARRLPFALSDATIVHAALVTVFILIVVAIYFVLRRQGAPTKAQRGVLRLLLIGSLQGLVGVVQYFTHLPVGLVEIHVCLAASVTIGVTQFNLAQTGRDREVGLEKQA